MDDKFRVGLRITKRSVKVIFGAQRHHDEEGGKKKKKPKKPKFDDDIDIKDLIPDFDDEEEDDAEGVIKVESAEDSKPPDSPSGKAEVPDTTAPTLRKPSGYLTPAELAAQPLHLREPPQERAGVDRGRAPRRVVRLHVRLQQDPRRGRAEGVPAVRLAERRARLPICGG